MTAPDIDDLVPTLDVVSHRFPSSQGVTVAVHDWGGDGPPLVLAHATGLHAHVWLPLVQRLRLSFRCIGVDLRAQGFTTAPDDDDFTWRGVQDDIVVALDRMGLSGRGDVRGIGHSMGGYAVLAAALARPGTFSHVIGMEPVCFMLPDGVAPWSRLPNPMAEITARRRRSFISAQVAFENFAGKPPFLMCDPAVTASYVRFGFSTEDDGTVTLRCPPEHEAELFRSSYTDLMERLPGVTADTTLLLGEHTNENFKVSVPEQARRIPRARVIHLPGRTHFAILEGTDEMAALCLAHLGVDGDGIAP